MSTTARAIVFPEPRKVEFQSYEVPEPREDEILVETEYSGVSQGTEIWAYQGLRPELSFPTVPGYQTIGRVVQVGQSSVGFSVGQRVMVKSNRLPECFPETWMGAHASHIVTQEALVLPEGCDPVGAAISALAAVSLRGIRMLDIDFGDAVLVTGQGLIGQCSAQLALLRGAIVVASDINSVRLALSQAHSADIPVNIREESLEGVVKKISPQGLDAVIETTGKSSQFAPLVDLLRWEGQFLLQGWYADPVSFDFHTTHMKKPKVAITCGFDLEEVRDCLLLLAREKLRLRELLSHFVPVEQAPDVYPALERGDPSFLGVVFDWTGGRP